MNVKGMNVEGVVRVDNARVYGLEESIIASGYPKALDTVNMDSYQLIDVHGDEYIDVEMVKYHDDGSDGRSNTQVDKDFMKRAKYLGKAAAGSGHDCYLKGITVQFDLQLPEYIWRQLNRYHFIDFVSSQSKMHKILELDVDEICNKYVSQRSLDELNYWIRLYNNFDEYTKHYNHIVLRNGDRIEFTMENIFNMIIANTPSGIMLTARMTTNYLQLKSMISQREFHKMQEWKYLAAWFKQLPLVDTIVLKK